MFSEKSSRQLTFNASSGLLLEAAASSGSKCQGHLCSPPNSILAVMQLFGLDATSLTISTQSGFVRVLMSRSAWLHVVTPLAAAQGLSLACRAVLHRLAEPHPAGEASGPWLPASIKEGALLSEYHERKLNDGDLIEGVFLSREPAAINKLLPPYTFFLLLFTSNFVFII